MAKFQSQTRLLDSLLVALAAVSLGSAYPIADAFLSADHPITISLLRALPAGVLLLFFARQLPRGIWIWRCLLLGALNFSIYWILLFVAAFRLPGGVAATLASMQPLMIVFLAALILKSPIRLHSLLTAIIAIGALGVLFITPQAGFDFYGTVAALVCCLSLAIGMVLTKLWQPPVSALTFTAWQLLAGGLLLAPIALIFEPEWPPYSLASIISYVYLAVFAAALAYVLFFRGIASLGPGPVSMLCFFSPITAFLLGWLFLDQTFSPLQSVAIVAILIAIFLESWLAE